MRAARLLVISLMVIAGPGTAQETTTYVAHYLEPFRGPQVYKDVHSGTTLHVETDGRHVAAISWTESCSGIEIRTRTHMYRVTGQTSRKSFMLGRSRNRVPTLEGSRRNSLRSRLTTPSLGC